MEVQVANLFEPRLAAEVDAHHVLDVCGTGLVDLQEVHDKLDVAGDHEDHAILGPVLKQLACFGCLDNTASSREDVTLGLLAHNTLEEVQLLLTEAIPVVILEHLGNSHALSALELGVEINDRPAKDLACPLAGGRLACTPHANNEDRLFHLTRGKRAVEAVDHAVRVVDLGLCTFHLDAERLMLHVPPTRPSLTSALTLGNEGLLGRDGTEHGEAHGDTVVIVAVDRIARLLNVHTAAVNLDTVIKLAAGDAELGQLVVHGLDAVALLLPLVGNTSNSGGSALLTRLGHCRKYAGSKESIGHGLHVDVGNRDKFAYWWASDRGTCLTLLNRATHRPQYLNGKPGITLQRGGTDVRDGASGASDGGHGERVGGRTGITLNLILCRALVTLLRYVVHVRLGLASGDMHTERGHHGDGHVNVGLRDDLSSDQTKCDGLLCIRRTHQDGRNVLRRHLGVELNVATFEATSRGNAYRQALAARLANVID